MRYTSCYTQLRGSTYHMRVRIPRHIKRIANRTEITRSLKTDSKIQAHTLISTKIHLIRKLQRMPSKASRNELEQLFEEMTDFSSVDQLSEFERTVHNCELQGLEFLQRDVRDSLSNGGATVIPPTKAQPNTCNVEAWRAFESLFLTLLQAKEERFLNGDSREFRSLLEHAEKQKSNYPEASYSLSKAYEELKAFKKWNQSYLNKANKWFEFTLCVWGDVDVKYVSKQMVRQALQGYSQLPDPRKKPYKEMTMFERIECDVPEEDMISSKTAKDYLAFLQSLFSTYLVAERDILETSPTNGVTCKFDSSSSRYGLYTDSEVNTLLGGLEKETDIWKKWGCLIAIYSGMRMSEIAHALKNGIQQDSETGIHYFCIKEGKTDNAKRNVPVHKCLLELGILSVDFSGISNLGLSHYVVKLRDSSKIPERDINGFKRIFHSFRHTFITKALRQTEDVLKVQSVVGHEKRLGITERYFHGHTLDELQDVVNMVIF